MRFDRGQVIPINITFIGSTGQNSRLQQHRGLFKPLAKNNSRSTAILNGKWEKPIKLLKK